MVLLIRGDDIDGTQRDSGDRGGQDKELLELALRVRAPAGNPGVRVQARKTVFGEY